MHSVATRNSEKVQIGIPGEFKLEFQENSNWNSRRIQIGIPGALKSEFQKHLNWNSKSTQIGIPGALKLEFQEHSNRNSRRIPGAFKLMHLISDPFDGDPTEDTTWNQPCGLFLWAADCSATWPCCPPGFQSLFFSIQGSLPG